MEIPLVLRILILLAVSVFLFHCVRKKKEPDTLEGWLERHFPYRMKIVDTYTENPIRNLSFSKKKSVVADRSDSLLQILIRWDKREPAIGITKEEVNQLFAKAKTELEDARSLHALLKSSGMEKISTCIHLGDARILLYEQPAPEHRKSILENIKPVLAKWPPAKRYGLWIEYMEPESYRAEFEDIVPLALWLRADNWLLRNMILSIALAEGYEFDPDKLQKQWQFNTESNRLIKWLEQARPLAQEWAKSHIRKPLVFASEAEYQALEKALGAEFRFPFYEGAKPPDSSNYSGYILGDYFLDGERFENLRQSKE